MKSAHKAKAAQKREPERKAIKHHGLLELRGKASNYRIRKTCVDVIPIAYRLGVTQA